MNGKKAVAIVGTGPGLGAALAEAFAQQGHPVAIGSRSIETLQSLARSINDALGSPEIDRVKAFSVDASDTSSVRSFVRQASQSWSSETMLHVGIWNPNAGFGIRPFQQWSQQEMDQAFRVQSSLGAHAFTQEFLDRCYDDNRKEDGGLHKGTLLYTGATAALKGASNFAGFAAAKAGLRMMVESLAREHSRNGIHACHIIIDGLLDTEAVTKQVGSAAEEHEVSSR